MPTVNAKELLTSGAHFGHRTSRWNPKMEPYILGKRNKIHIINLRETVKGIIAAYFFCRKTVAEGKQVLFVGTKRQAREAITIPPHPTAQPHPAHPRLTGPLTN